MNESPARNVFDLMIGYWASQGVYVATKLEIPEHIDSGKTTSQELAAATDSHQHSLFQLLRFLSGIGVLQGDDEQGFHLTPTSKLLKKDSAESLRDLVLMYGEEFYRAWGNLLHNVRTGEPAFEFTFDSPMYAYFAENQESARRFDGTMSGGSFFRDLPRVHDFSKSDTVVDIAGGAGGLLCEVLEASPRTRGILFDRGHVIDSAREGIAKRKLADRVSFVEGDYTDSVPSGGDTYLLSRILHSRTDESCVNLLKNCHRAMKPGGTVIVVERTIPPSGTSSLGLWFDMHMMVLVGGAERSEQDYIDLFERSGFTFEEILPLSLDMYALVAKRT
ncbi:hypothetical protein IL38_08160 [Actinopolyspora erythraea]|nr:methyltransferase [Actinopolyspora erythraea]KGI81980.1 hypothetical protein IL38_08160 [Actinopolyspora erythraea]